MLHPGYGFLSERPELAARCAAAGLRFAGPGRDALALFGDKAAARARARELGVPVLAGTGADPAPGQVLALLREHGAVMIKAVAGGGGRGLRPVTSENLAEAGLAEARLAAARPATRAWPPPSSWSRTTRSPSWRSTPGCRSSTRSPNRSPGWTWSSSGCASPTAPASSRWPWTP